LKEAIAHLDQLLAFELLFLVAEYPGAICASFDVRDERVVWIVAVLRVLVDAVGFHLLVYHRDVLTMVRVVGIAVAVLQDPLIVDVVNSGLITADTFV
jgi:hypothetical protein